ncbi:MAG TPA: class I SAM-dependent methyltransferase [Gammaproteobacteria bacterium]|nr:class I SAM-dependent methyltransferase [Gammaproteobacteria bacterium]
MQRVPEPELMDAPEQARAYAEADFAEAHDRLVSAFARHFPDAAPGHVLDLGCGPADVSVRFARAWPGARLDGIDAGPNMLALGRRAVEAAGLSQRVRLHQGYLPRAVPPRPAYDAIISNSLLHHLAEPGALWEAVRRFGAPGARVLVMDLTRPADERAWRELVARYGADAPTVLREDFGNSLRAAYRPEEVAAQLDRAGLALSVELISDRHLVVWGRMPG